jgi:3',5'-cyclic AMP phosphodiesterase CpdA
MNRREFLALSTAVASASTAGGVAATKEDEVLVSFGLITDVQYADAAPEGERHYRESLAKLEAAAADLSGLKLAFTLHLGDVIDRDFASFARVLPHFGEMGHPVRHLLGNHDYSIEDAEKKNVVSLLGMEADYYAFGHSGVRFVMLDTNEVSTYKHPQGDAADLAAEKVLRDLGATGANNGKPWNGGVSTHQLEWLEKQLAEAAARHEAVIVCGHHPLLPEEGHHAWNHRDILAVLQRHDCVKAYLCGHNHAGGEVVSGGIPFITFKSLLHEPGVTSYAVLRLFRNCLVIEGRGREKSRVVPLRPVEK